MATERDDENDESSTKAKPGSRVRPRAVSCGGARVDPEETEAAGWAREETRRNEEARKTTQRLFRSYEQTVIISHITHASHQMRHKE